MSRAPESCGPRRALGESEESGSPQRVIGGERRTGFFNASAWTIVAMLFPPAGLIRSGRPVLGWGIIVLTMTGLGTAGYLFLSQRTATLTTLASMFNSQGLLMIGMSIAVAGLLWVTIIGYTHLKTRPVAPRLWQRAAGAFLVGSLSFLVAAPMAVGVRYTYDTASLFGAVFDSKSGTRPSLNTNPLEDPFNGRLNILLLGGDDGFGRDTAVGSRTDTVIVASIDTDTGDVVLISLPRNLGRMPFPNDSPLSEYYPNGFYDGMDPDNPEFFLNSMYDNVPDNIPEDILGPTDNLGADVMKISVGHALGLEIAYYAMFNLDGFKDLIDALDGITVNINYRVPKGGSTDKGIPPKEWLDPGPDQRLNGSDALWYARGRYGLDDYSRMERQRCVISAVIRQADATTLLTRYEAIARAGKQIIRTDVDSAVIPSLMPVASKVQDKMNIGSIVFKHGVDGFSSPRPNFIMMRDRVDAAINPAPTTRAPAPAKSPATATSPTDETSSAASSPSEAEAETEPTPPAEDTSDACAYNPDYGRGFGWALTPPIAGRSQGLDVRVGDECQRSQSAAAVSVEVGDDGGFQHCQFYAFDVADQVNHAAVSPV